MWAGSENISNLAIDFTTRCNLRCEYCYLYSKQDVPQQDMTVEELVAVVEKTLRIFPRIQMIELWGGEPTFDPERLFKFVQAIRAKGIDTWIPSTNGTLIHKQENYEAWRYCNQKFNSQISFDGNKKYHDKYRCNTYDRVVSNIEFCLKQDIPIALRTTYPSEIFLDGVKENMVEFPALYKRMEKIPGIQKRLLDHTFAVMEYKDRKLLMLYQEIDTIHTRQEVLDIAEDYRASYEKIEEYMDSFLNDDVIFMPPYISDTVQSLVSNKKYKEPKNCGSFMSQVYLHSPTGDVYPCLSQDVKQYKRIAYLMNVHTGEINWPAVNTIRAFMYRRNRACIGCFIQESCFGGCYHTIPETNNTFNNYWNTYNITKCTFAHRIFDIVVRTSRRLLDRIDKDSKEN